MPVKLLTEHHLELLRLKGGCTCSSELALVKNPHCWKSHVTTHMLMKAISKPKLLLPDFQTSNESFNIGEIMDTWTRQMGYPVINVIPDGNFYRLEQSRFLYNYNATDTDDSPYR